MKLKLLSNNEINSQIEALIKKALLADLLVFAAALPFYGLNYEVPLGLLVGTAAMTANMLLLGYSAEHCVERPSVKSAKRCMFSFYLIRLAVMGAAIVWGFYADYLDPAAVCIPLFWPKILLTGSAIFKRKK
ncbi:MAG: ATP synthase subunit I [Huintestinicola sp.]